MFLDLVNTPLTYLFPLVATVLAVGPVFVRLRDRFISLHRQREGLNTLVVKFFGVAMTISVSFGASVILWPALVAFLVWPLLGNPNVFPEDYGLTTQSAAQAAMLRTSYSQILVHGEWTYALTYAAIVASAAAAFAVAAVSAMLLTHSLAISMLAPWLVFLGWTIAASLVGAPRAAPLYSIFPAGLTQATIGESIWPTAAIVVIAASLVVLAAWKSVDSPWAR